MADFLDDYNSQPKKLDKKEWGVQKKAEKEKAYHTIDEMTVGVCKSNEKLMQYLDKQSQLDRYSVANVLLILSQRPDATKLKDWQSWKEKNISIKANEKGIVILEPSEQQNKDGSKAIYFNSKNVFDISQTTAPQERKESKRLPSRVLLKALLQSCTVKIVAVDNLENANKNAHFEPKENTIFVKRGLDDNQLFKALSGEIAQTYLDNNDSKFSTDCISYMLCKKYKFDISTFDLSMPDAYKDEKTTSVRTFLSEIRSKMVEINDNMQQSIDKQLNKNDRNFER